jgi:hypothetical protein
MCVLAWAASRRPELSLPASMGIPEWCKVHQKRDFFAPEFACDVDFLLHSSTGKNRYCHRGKRTEWPPDVTVKKDGTKNAYVLGKSAVGGSAWRKFFAMQQENLFPCSIDMPDSTYIIGPTT